MLLVYGIARKKQGTRHKTEIKTLYNFCFKKKDCTFKILTFKSKIWSTRTRQKHKHYCSCKIDTSY